MNTILSVEGRRPDRLSLAGPPASRHPELVSGSSLDAAGRVESWILKQVQDDIPARRGARHVPATSLAPAIPGRVSKAIQPDYVTRYFSPNNAELARLRRFIAGE